MPSAREIAEYLDQRLDAARFRDYDNAHNGLQLDHHGPVRRVATAVDFSRETIETVIARDANMLILHHGMFWGGTRPIVGVAYDRLANLLTHDVAVYASHLPLDAHPTLGNCALLATALELVPNARFGEHDGVSIGVAGDSELDTHTLLARTDGFARTRGGTARASAIQAGRVTRRWAIITGAGVGTDEIRDAASRGIDTLIVGEGPHHTAVDAPDHGLVIIYAGHYATETLGVQSLASLVSGAFGIAAEFLLLPTGS